MSDLRDRNLKFETQLSRLKNPHIIKKGADDETVTKHIKMVAFPYLGGGRDDTCHCGSSGYVCAFLCSNHLFSNLDINNLIDTTMTAIATKFVQWDVQPLESLKGSKAYDLRERLNNGDKMNRIEKNWLAEKVNSSTYFKDSVPVMGWRFDFSDVLKKFLVNQYGQWSEYNAPDKTSLREVLCGRINQIVELQN